MRRKGGRSIADRNHRSKGVLAVGLGYPLDRGRHLMKPNRNGGVAPGVVEHRAAIGRQHQIDVQPLCGFAERTCLIPGRRRDEKNARPRCHVLEVPTGSEFVNAIGR